MKGIVYIITTTVSGLIKIGKAGMKNYKERMRFLEANGYHNVTGLKRFFAIELEDYDDKESLLHEIFSKYQVGDSELFALDCELAKQLLLAFDGKVVYPENVDKECEFDEVVQLRKQSALFSFYQKGLKNGDEIYKLSPLTRDTFSKKVSAMLVAHIKVLPIGHLMARN